MAAVTIGKTARAAGVGVETIRFYERRGLIDQPSRPASAGYRVYPVDTVRRIQFIRQAQQIGFSLREIKELLSLRADPSADCSDVRERARAKVAEVDRKIAELERIRAALEEVIAACPGHGALRACTILEALEVVRRPRSRSASPLKHARGARTMKSVTLEIEGMHCEGCAQTIKALIDSEPGVRAADVSYKDRQARILYDPQTVGEDQLVRVIEKGGYRVPARKP